MTDLFTNKGHVPPCANSIVDLIAKCLTWLNNSNAIGKYKDFNELAIDFGIHGTTSFFPLSMMVNSLYKDEKFFKFVRSEK